MICFWARLCRACSLSDSHHLLPCWSLQVITVYVIGKSFQSVSSVRCFRNSAHILVQALFILIAIFLLSSQLAPIIACDTRSWAYVRNDWYNILQSAFMFSSFSTGTIYSIHMMISYHSSIWVSWCIKPNNFHVRTHLENPSCILHK